MDNRITALEEKVAFLEDSLSKISRTVEEMNVQLVGVMKEVHNIRRTRGPADQIDTEDSEHVRHF
jgi:uncharacterized coiled-coil protein SlyX